MQVIAVVGLGYVGLPLAVEFGKKFRTIGLDVSTDKVDAYRRHVDPTGEITDRPISSGFAARAHDRRHAAAVRRHHHCGGTHADRRRSSPRLRSTDRMPALPSGAI